MDASYVSQIVIQNYLDAIAMVILYYDHALTLVDEIRYVWWSWRFTGSWLFLLNRYFAFFSTLTWIGGFAFWISEERCGAYSLYRQLLVGIIELVVAVTMFLKVYGLYGRDKRVLALVGSVAVPLSVICARNLANQSSTAIVGDGLGCHIELSPASGVRLALPWESMLFYDVLIFSLTFLKTYTAMRRYRTNRTWGLAALMFRDGAMYYAILTCANLANVLTFYFMPPILMGSLSTIAGSISVTMVSRTMLNLHRTAYDSAISRSVGANGSVTALVFLTTRIELSETTTTDNCNDGRCIEADVETAP